MSSVSNFFFSNKSVQDVVGGASSSGGGGGGGGNQDLTSVLTNGNVTSLDMTVGGFTATDGASLGFGGTSKLNTTSTGISVTGNGEFVGYVSGAQAIASNQYTTLGQVDAKFANVAYTNVDNQFSVNQEFLSTVRVRNVLSVGAADNSGTAIISLLSSTDNRVVGRDGSLLEFWQSVNNRGGVQTDGTWLFKNDVAVNGNATVNGGLTLNAADDDIMASLTEDGGRGLLRLYRNSGSAYLQLFHDGTNGSISTTAGDLVLSNNTITNGSATVNGTLSQNGAIVIGANTIQNGLGTYHNFSSTNTWQIVTATGGQAVQVNSTDISLNRNTTINGNATVNGSLYLYNTISNYWRLVVDSSTNLEFKRGTTLKGEWSESLLTIYTDTEINGNATVNGTLSVDGSVINLNGTDTTISNNVGNLYTRSLRYYIQNTDSTFTRALFTDSLATIYTDTTINGNATVNGDLFVDGDNGMYLSSGASTGRLRVAGGANELLQILNLSGVTQFQVIGLPTLLDGATTINGNAVINGQLNVTSETTYSTVDRSGGVTNDGKAGIYFRNGNPAGSSSYRGMVFYATGYSGSAVTTYDVMEILGTSAIPIVDVKTRFRVAPSATVRLDVTDSQTTIGNNTEINGTATVTNTLTAVNARITSWAGGSSYAYFGHTNNNTSTRYALINRSDGLFTYVNATNTVGLRINNVPVLDATSSGISVAGVISGNGSGITNINASNISSGTLSASRLPSTFGPASALELTSSVDLNSLDTSGDAGFYYQIANADTGGNNYPNGQAGSLIVQKSATVSSIGVTQLYQTYNPTTPELYFRSAYGSFSSWRRVIHDGNYTSYVTKSYVDGLGINATTLDGIDGANFLRSDTSDTMNGTLTVTGGEALRLTGTSGFISFFDGSATRHGFIQGTGSDMFFRAETGSLNLQSNSGSININNNTNVTGNIVATGNVTANNFVKGSARHKKKLIEDLNFSWQDACKVQPRQYIKKASDKAEFGYIIDELPEKLQEVVSEDKESLDYDSVNTAMIAAMMKKIDELENKIKELEK